MTMANGSAVIAVALCLLAVMVSTPKINATVQGQDSNNLPHHRHSGSRPVISCNEIETSQQSCQNLARNSIHNISSQIRMELNASYTYMAMSSYFNRDDVAFPGFSKFFSGASDEEREHAQKLIKYLNKRGGRVNFKTIHSPTKQTWDSGPLEALEDALVLEHAVNKALLDLHWEAQQKNDPHLQDFLESEFLTEQVDSIRELSEWRTIVARMQTDALGLYKFDRYLLEHA